MNSRKLNSRELAVNALKEKYEETQIKDRDDAIELKDIESSSINKMVSETLDFIVKNELWDKDKLSACFR